MRGRAPTAPDDDFKDIISYLARFFGPEVNVNPNLTTVMLDGEQG
jgi:hypothetical protein